MSLPVYELELNKEENSFFMTYDCPYVLFSFASLPKNGKVMLQSKLIKCREEVATYLEQWFNGYEHGKVSLNKLCMVCAIYSNKPKTDIMRRDFVKKMLSSKKIINLLEAKYKWPRTEMFVLKNKDEKGLMAVGFIASAKWQRSPQMLSLFTLLLRSGHHIVSASSKTITSIIDIMSAIKRLSKYSLKDNDCEHITKTCNFWCSIMRNFDKLFYRLPMKLNYSQKMYSSFYLGEDGVLMLCKGDSDHKVLSKRFKKYCS